MIAVTPMRILSETQNTRLEERQLVLDEGLSAGKINLGSRSILSFYIESGGYSAVGEAAPLPGYSSETYQECLEALQDAAHELQ